MKRRRKSKRRKVKGGGLPEPLQRDVLALALAAGGVLGLVALFGGGPRGLLVALRLGMRGAAGVAAPLLPLFALALGAAVLFRYRAPGGAFRWLGGVMGGFVVAGFAHLGWVGPDAFRAGVAGRGGGLAGAALDTFLESLLGGAGARVVLWTGAVAAVLLVFQFSLRAAIAWPVRSLARGLGGTWRTLYGFVTEPVPEDDARQATGRESGRRRPQAAADTETPATVEPVAMGVAAGALAAAAEPVAEPPAMHEAAPAADELLPDLIGHRHGEAAAAADPPKALPLAPGVLYQTPPMDLLRKNTGVRATRSRDGQQRAAQLEEALRSFGIAARVVDVTQGPSITRFEVQPGVGVKVARIAGLSDDLALTLRATDVRIVAPIPGKAAVGIEVPNTDVTPVYLREVMESPEFQTAASPLTVCLGQDIAGKPVVASLELLLHVLVAGATGSGKSITINCMLMSLLFKSSPEQVRLVLIDPKMVELSQYNGVPHLLAPVVTDPRKAAATLRVVVKEMERRYGLFQTAGVRNIGGYNGIAPSRGETPLPFVVVVIDELADLMLVARADVEDAIQRLTQMARAAGIHLIVATQRPSVDVITGVIKANIPTRIALAVASQVDSRTILDVAGAEKLVGRGDMLFRPIGAQKLIRAQGAYVGESEVEGVLQFLRSVGRPEYDTAIMEAEPDDSGGGGDAGEDDDLFVQALQVVVESGQASVSNLQRRLRVGFTRAGRLVDMMEQRGFVGPHQGSKSREVLLTMDQFRRLYGDRPGPD